MELATGIQNYCLSFMGPVDDNTQVNSGGSIDTNATGQSEKNHREAFGKDFPAGEDPSYNADKYCYDAQGDPMFSDIVYRERNTQFGVKKAPVIPSEVGECYLGRTDSYYNLTPPEMPDYAVKVLERAAFRFDIPAALLMSVLYSEGSFHKFEWTDQTVIDGSIEGESFNGDVCNVGDTSGGVGPFDFTCAAWTGTPGGACDLSKTSDYANAVKVDFPNRVPNRCNFLDQAYAAAKRLKESAAGASSYGYNTPTRYSSNGDCAAGDCSDKMCYGVHYSSTFGDCAHWNISNTVSASRGFGGFCFDNKFSGTRGDTYTCLDKDGNLVDLVGHPERKSLCREGYDTCSTGIDAKNGGVCTSYQYHWVDVFNYFKNSSQ